MDNYPKLLISGSFNVFNEGWDGAGVYMCSGLYRSETFKLPIYIGSSINLEKRIENRHIYDLDRNQHRHNQPLQNGWNKHGKENFVWWLLESCDKQNQFDIEQKYLDLYRPFIDEFGGFNIAHDAKNSGKGRKYTDEEKRVLSKKYTGENNPFYGKKHDEETRARMSRNRPKIVEKKRKKVICIETGVTYPSITEAGKQTGITSIGYVLRGITQTAGGYHWRLAN